MKSAKAINIDTGEQQYFRSSCQAGKILDIESKCIRNIAAKETFRKSAKSRSTGIWYKFE